MCCLHKDVKIWSWRRQHWPTSLTNARSVQLWSAILLSCKSLVSAHPTWTMNLESNLQNGLTRHTGLYLENTWCICFSSPSREMLNEKKSKQQKRQKCLWQKLGNDPFGVPEDKTVQAHNLFNGVWKVPPVAHHSRFTSFIYFLGVFSESEQNCSDGQKNLFHKNNWNHGSSWWFQFKCRHHVNTKLKAQRFFQLSENPVFRLIPNALSF